MVGFRFNGQACGSEYIIMLVYFIKTNKYKKEQYCR